MTKIGTAMAGMTMISVSSITKQRFTITSMNAVIYEYKYPSDCDCYDWDEDGWNTHHEYDCDCNLDDKHGYHTGLSSLLSLG